MSALHRLRELRAAAGEEGGTVIALPLSAELFVLAACSSPDRFIVVVSVFRRDLEDGDDPRVDYGGLIARAVEANDGSLPGLVFDRDSPIKVEPLDLVWARIARSDGNLQAQLVDDETCAAFAWKVPWAAVGLALEAGRRLARATWGGPWGETKVVSGGLTEWNTRTGRFDVHAAVEEG